MPSQKSLRVRRAEENDIAALQRLLVQVGLVHHNGRPDLFRATTKYSAEDLTHLLKEEHFPVFVAESENGEILGHAFCQIVRHEGERLLEDIQTLYIDDICVDESARRKGVGRLLYKYVVDYARAIHCHNVTLNVWECNPAALAFYRACGLAFQKYGMELVLDTAKEKEMA